MSCRLRGRAVLQPFGRGRLCPKSRCWRANREGSGGFTLVELLIVLVVLPIVVGALTLGIMSVLSLQSSVANRLSDTSDAQVVSGSYSLDVEGAYNITTASTSDPQCGEGTGTQLLGLEMHLDTTTGNPQTIISYVNVPVGSGSSEYYSLERLQCSGEGNFSTYTETTLAYDLSAANPAPNVTCVAAYTTCQSSVTGGWTPSDEINQVIFPITEPKSNYSYTLVAAPEASTAASNQGSPAASSSTTSCNPASPGTGAYAGNLCFVDFTSLTGAAMDAATGGGCLEMSASIGNGYTMYFCVSISGYQVAPYPLPTYPEAFLGNTNAGTDVGALKNVPFYTGVPGEPALYQYGAGGGTTTITFSNISVVTASGQLATGWQVFSADAETTDSPDEYIIWNTPAGSPLSILPDGISAVDTTSDPVGNACGAGDGLFYSQTVGSTTTDYSAAPANAGKYDTVECEASGTVNGVTFSTTSDWKDGAAFVTAPAPSSLTAQMRGNGLQAIVFGLYYS